MPPIKEAAFIIYLNVVKATQDGMGRVEMDSTRHMLAEVEQFESFPSSSSSNVCVPLMPTLECLTTCFSKNIFCWSQVLLEHLHALFLIAKSKLYLNLQIFCCFVDLSLTSLVSGTLPLQFHKLDQGNTWHTHLSILHVEKENYIF